MSRNVHDCHVFFVGLTLPVQYGLQYWCAHPFCSDVNIKGTFMHHKPLQIEKHRLSYINHHKAPKDFLDPF